MKSQAIKYRKSWLGFVLGALLLIQGVSAPSLKAGEIYTPTEATTTWNNDYKYTISPSGHLIAVMQRGDDPEIGGMYRIFILNPDAPKNRVRLSGVFIRGVEVLFSPDDQWIVVNNFPCTGSCTPILFQQEGNLRYKRPKGINVDEQVRALYAKDTGDLKGSKAGIFVNAFYWKPDSSAFQLYLGSKYGDLKVDLWTAYYNVRTRSACDPSSNYHFGKMFNGSGLSDANQDLKAMYKLVYGKLNPQAQRRLKLDERSWLKKCGKFAYNEQYEMTNQRIQHLFEMLPGNQ